MGGGTEQIIFQRKHTDGQQVHGNIFATTNYPGNANQNHNKVSLHMIEWLSSKDKQ